MTLERFTADQIRTHEQELMVRVPADAPVGNVRLRSQLLLLGWSESLYWDVRKHLIQRGVLAPGHGKGGSVRRIPQAITQGLDAVAAPTIESVTEADNISQQYADEKDLYLPMSEAIRNGWAKDRALDSVIVEITAQQGARPAGKWTRPDITLASFQTFPYVPGRHFDVVTFEVKPHSQVNVSAVYEALGQLRAATRSYVLLHVPHFAKASLEVDIDETCREAKQQGIGVIIAEKPDSYDTWDEQVEAVRREPDPARLNDFLAQQVSLEFREHVIRWLK